jgi:hypothetical protein
VNSFNHLVSFCSSFPPPGLRNKILYSLATETHFTPGAAVDEVIEVEFFPLISDGPDRR